MSDNLSGDEKIIDDILESYNGHTKALPRHYLWVKPEQYQKTDVLLMKQLQDGIGVKKSVGINSITQNS